MRYAHKISSADSQIHLDQPADTLQRKINAYTPYPGAFVETSFGRLKLIQARPADAAGQPMPPGQFCGLSDEGGLILACGQNTALEVAWLQPAGKKAMTARAGQRRLRAGLVSASGGQSWFQQRPRDKGCRR